MRNMLPPLPERSKRPAPVETEIVANRSRRERQLDEIAHRWKPQRKQQKLSDALDKQRLTLRKKAEKKEEVPVKREPEETERNVTQRTPLQALHLLRKNIHNRGKFAKVVETLLQLVRNNHICDEIKLEFIHTLYDIATSDNCATCAKARLSVISLFGDELKRIMASVDDKNADPWKVRFGPEEIELVDVLRISAFHRNNLITDDNFKFNTAMARLSDVFLNLEPLDLTTPEQTCKSSD
eukprot:GHVU01157769.1.p1 GENE.GHVU01157769.1~~GHVU01157769.1.p1  ORF type:complete len:239 (+),score=26.31 GHVU01157769.1:134-850(+)